MGMSVDDYNKLKDWKKQDIKKKVGEIKGQMDKTTSDYDKEKFV